MVVMAIAFVSIFYFGFKREGRKAGISFLVSIVSFIGVGIFADTVEVEEEEEKTEVVEEVIEEEEEEILELTSEEKEFFTKDYAGLLASEKRKVIKIISEVEEYGKEDRGIINENKERIEQEKLDFDEEEEEKDRAEKELKEAERKENVKISNYTDFVVRTSSEYGESFRHFSSQMESVSYTDDWVFATSGVIFKIEEISDEIIEYDTDSVPEIYTEAHKEYVLGALKFKESMELFIEGFDAMDPEIIGRSTEAMDEGSAHIDEVTRLTSEANSI